MQKNINKGFTLVELIVVITILAILGTIAFISMHTYTKVSRDSIRISDLNNMKKMLDLYHIDAGKYPEPSGGELIVFSGAEAWNQGTLGKSVLDRLGSFNNKPTDPLTGSDYTYSLLNTNNEYELGAIVEGDLLGLNNSFLNTYAEVIRKGKAMILGNYNGESLIVNTLGYDYILATPSIINSDMTLTDIIEILKQRKLVKSLYNNLPYSYKGSKYSLEGGYNFINDDPVVFKGDLDDLYSDENIRIGYIKKLQNIYNQSIISGDTAYASLLGIDIMSEEGRQLLETKVERLVKKEKEFIKADILGESCGNEDGTFENMANGFNISDSCLFKQSGTSDWIIEDGSGNGGGKAIKNLSSNTSNSTTFSYTVLLSKPAKFSFDYKYSSLYGNTKFYLNNIEHLGLGGALYNGNTGPNYKTYKTTLLPSGTYTFKWVVERAWPSEGYSDLLLDNLTFSCLGGGNGCGIDLGIEDGNANPWNIFSFEGNITFPWETVTDSSTGLYAIKNPKQGNSKTAIIKYKVNKTQPFEFNFDYKIDMYSSNNTLFLINGIEYDEWTASTVGYQSKRTSLLPAGDYTFEWRVFRNWNDEHLNYLYLDNLHFTCEGGGTGCGWDDGFENGDINPWDLVNFHGSVNIPWDRVTDSSNLTYAIKNPTQAKSSTVKLTKIFNLATSGTVSFDYKIYMYSSNNTKIYVDNVLKNTYTSSTSGFNTYTTSNLSAGSHEIRFEVYRNWNDEHKNYLTLDNFIIN